MLTVYSKYCHSQSWFPVYIEMLDWIFKSWMQIWWNSLFSLFFFGKGLTRIWLVFMLKYIKANLSYLSVQNFFSTVSDQIGHWQMNSFERLKYKMCKEPVPSTFTLFWISFPSTAQKCKIAATDARWNLQSFRYSCSNSASKVFLLCTAAILAVVISPHMREHKELL